LEQFVCVSSIASLVGGLGMASYSSANAFLDALMRYRRTQGLPGAAFNMSSLSDVGILANNLSARKFQLKMGVEYITSFRALQELEVGLVTKMNPIITMFFKEKTRTMFPAQAPWSHHLQVGSVDRLHYLNTHLIAFVLHSSELLSPFSRLSSPFDLCQETILLGAVSGKGEFMSAKDIAAFLAEEIKDITGAAEVLVTQQLVSRFPPPSE
jgi:hypothetical protein